MASFKNTFREHGELKGITWDEFYRDDWSLFGLDWDLAGEAFTIAVSGDRTEFAFLID